MLCALVIIECLCVLAELSVDLQTIRLRFENEESELAKFIDFLKAAYPKQFNSTGEPLSLEEVLRELQYSKIRWGEKQNCSQSTKMCSCPCPCGCPNATRFKPSLLSGATQRTRRSVPDYEFSSDSSGPLQSGNQAIDYTDYTTDDGDYISSNFRIHINNQIDNVVQFLESSPESSRVQDRNNENTREKLLRPSDSNNKINNENNLDTTSNYNNKHNVDKINIIKSDKRNNVVPSVDMVSSASYVMKPDNYEEDTLFDAKHRRRKRASDPEDLSGTSTDQEIITQSSNVDSNTVDSFTGSEGLVPPTNAEKVFVIQIHNSKDSFYMLGHIFPDAENETMKHERKVYFAYKKLHLASKCLHFGSIAILFIMVVETCIKFFCMGKAFCRKKFEVFDAFIVISSFCLDFVFLDSRWYETGKDAATILVLLLPWRVVRIVNSFLMTMNHKHKIEMMTIQRAKKKAESKIVKLQSLMNEMRRDVELLVALSRNNGIQEEEIQACIYGKGRAGATMSAISSFASLMLISTLGKDRHNSPEDLYERMISDCLKEEDDEEDIREKEKEREKAHRVSKRGSSRRHHDSGRKQTPLGIIHEKVERRRINGHAVVHKTPSLPLSNGQIGNVANSGTGISIGSGSCKLYSPGSGIGSNTSCSPSGRISLPSMESTDRLQSHGYVARGSANNVNNNNSGISGRLRTMNRGISCDIGGGRRGDVHSGCNPYGNGSGNGNSGARRSLGNIYLVCNGYGPGQDLSPGVENTPELNHNSPVWVQRNHSATYRDSNGVFHFDNPLQVTYL